MLYKPKRIYFIFIFSILLHLFFILVINNFKFINNVKLIRENRIEIDLIPQRNTEKYPANLPIPPLTSNAIFEKIREIKTDKIRDISPPQIEPVNIANQNTDTKNLLNIPANIPSIFPKKIKKAVRGHKNLKKREVNRDNILKNYLYSIRKKIEKNKNYPIIARKMGLEGITCVEFALDKVGRVISIKILKTSGTKILDRAAITSIKQAQPFFHIPKQLNLNEIKVKLSIVFHIE